MILVYIANGKKGVKMSYTTIQGISYDCFTCPSWNSGGCTLTSCCMTKTYVYVNGKLIELTGEIRELEDEN